MEGDRSVIHWLFKARAGDVWNTFCVSGGGKFQAEGIKGPEVGMSLPVWWR